MVKQNSSVFSGIGYAEETGLFLRHRMSREYKVFIQSFCLLQSFGSPEKPSKQEAPVILQFQYSDE